MLVMTWTVPTIKRYLKSLVAACSSVACTGMTAPGISGVIELDTVTTSVIKFASKRPAAAGFFCLVQWLL